MEIVTGEPAPTVSRVEAARLLHEMAAVVRTVFAVPAPVSTSAPLPTPVAVAPLATPPPAPPPVTALPVPALTLPEPPDPEERRSLALLQEIAFLDE